MEGINRWVDPKQDRPGLLEKVQAGNGLEDAMDRGQAAQGGPGGGAMEPQVLLPHAAGIGHKPDWGMVTIGPFYWLQSGFENS